MTKIEAARALIAARDAHLAATAEAIRANDKYTEAEIAYFNACKAEKNGDNTPWHEYPSNLLVDGHLIMPVEDWWDGVKAGSRLSYHTVEVAAGEPDLSKLAVA